MIKIILFSFIILYASCACDTKKDTTTINNVDQTANPPQTTNSFDVEPNLTLSSIELSKLNGMKLKRSLVESYRSTFTYFDTEEGDHKRFLETLNNYYDIRFYTSSYPGANIFRVKRTDLIGQNKNQLLCTYSIGVITASVVKIFYVSGRTNGNRFKEEPYGIKITTNDLIYTDQNSILSVLRSSIPGLEPI